MFLSGAMNFLSLFGAFGMLSFGLALGEVAKLSFGDAPKTSSYFSTAELGPNCSDLAPMVKTTPEFLGRILTIFQRGLPWSKKIYQQLFSQLKYFTPSSATFKSLFERGSYPHFTSCPQLILPPLKPPPKVPTEIFLPWAKSNVDLQRSRRDKGFFAVFLYYPLLVDSTWAYQAELSPSSGHQKCYSDCSWVWGCVSDIFLNVLHFIK